MEEGRNMKELGPFGYFIFIVGACFLFIPYLIMDLIDVASETTEYERRCYKQ